MFYFNDKIILAVESSDVTARFNGVSSRCLLDANIPCSIDFKKAAVGEVNRRVTTDALVTVPYVDSHAEFFQVGAQFVVERLKGLFWEVLSVDIHEGVFGGAPTLELKCARRTGELPISGEGSIRQTLAARKAAIGRPGAPTGPGME